MLARHALWISVVLLVLMGCGPLAAFQTPTPTSIPLPTLTITPVVAMATSKATVTAIATATFTPEPTVEQTTTTLATISTPTPVCCEDCFVSFNIATWEDLDGNGQWDVSEPPLAGVKFQFHGVFMQLWGASLSDAEGQATLTAMSPGKCINQDVTITAIPPEAYEPTTPTSVIFEDVDLFTPVPQQFGFREISR